MHPDRLPRLQPEDLEMGPRAIRLVALMRKHLPNGEVETRFVTKPLTVFEVAPEEEEDWDPIGDVWA